MGFSVSQVQRISGLVGGTLLGLLPAVAYAHGGEETVASAPLWLGLAMLGWLIALFAAAAWWLSLFQCLSGPSDETWHQIIGKDLLVWSLPHSVLLGGILFRRLCSHGHPV